MLADAETLTPYDFGLEDRPASPAPSSGESSDTAITDLKEASRAAAAQIERRMIRAALETTDGNVTQAAERLGLSRRGLQLKMKELGLR